MPQLAQNTMEVAPTAAPLPGYVEPGDYFTDDDLDDCDLLTPDELAEMERLHAQWEREANREAAQMARDLRETLHAAGRDLVEHLHTEDIPLHSPQADRIAASLGYHQSTWSDSRNVTRRAKERTRAVARAANHDRQVTALRAQHADAPKPPATFTAPTSAPVAIDREAATIQAAAVAQATADLPAGLNRIVVHALETHARRERAQKEASAARKAARLAEDALRRELERIRRDVQAEVEPKPEPLPRDADYLPYLEKARAHFAAIARSHPDAAAELVKAWSHLTATFRQYVEWRLSESWRTGATFAEVADSWLRGAIFTANVKAGIE